MNLIKLITKILPAKRIYAHCDIPCKIYDPYAAQIAAHSVIRMTQMLIELENEGDDKAYHSQIARLTKVKEDHAEICKHEVRVIWGDYFKPEMIEKFPDLHTLVFEIMHFASKARQTIDLEASRELLSKVQQFAEMFYQSKDMESFRIPSGFPTEGEIVIHK